MRGVLGRGFRLCGFRVHASGFWVEGSGGRVFNLMGLGTWACKHLDFLGVV